MCNQLIQGKFLNLILCCFICNFFCFCFKNSNQRNRTHIIIWYYICTRSGGKSSSSSSMSSPERRPSECVWCEYVRILCVFVCMCNCEWIGAVESNNNDRRKRWRRRRRERERKKNVGKENIWHTQHQYSIFLYEFSVLILCTNVWMYPVCGGTPLLCAWRNMDIFQSSWYYLTIVRSVRLCTTKTASCLFVSISGVCDIYHSCVVCISLCLFRLSFLFYLLCATDIYIYTHSDFFFYYFHYYFTSLLSVSVLHSECVMRMFVSTYLFHQWSSGVTCCLLVLLVLCNNIISCVST